MTRWNIKNLIEDNKLFKVVQSDWKRLSGNYPRLNLLCTRKDLDKKVEWFEEKLTKLLNKYAKNT